MNKLDEAALRWHGILKKVDRLYLELALDVVEFQKAHRLPGVARGDILNRLVTPALSAHREQGKTERDRIKKAIMIVKKFKRLIDLEGGDHEFFLNCSFESLWAAMPYVTRDTLHALYQAVLDGKRPEAIRRMGEKMLGIVGIKKRKPRKEVQIHHRIAHVKLTPEVRKKLLAEFERKLENAANH